RVRAEEEGRDLGACAGASTAAGIYLHMGKTCGRTLRVGAADSGGSFWGRGETVADPQQFAQASAPCLGIGGRPGHGAGTPALPSPLAVTGHLRPSVRCCDALHRPVPGRCACARWSTHRDGPPVRSLAGYSCPGPPVVVAQEVDLAGVFGGLLFRQLWAALHLGARGYCSWSTIGIFAQEVLLPRPAAHIGPRGGTDMCAKLAIADDGRGIDVGIAARVPGATQVDRLVGGLGGEPACGEQQAIFSGCGVGRAYVAVVALRAAIERADLRVLQHSGGIAVDEVDVAFDERSGHIHTADRALRGSLCEQSVLVAANTHAVQDDAVANGA